MNENEAFFEELQRDVDAGHRRVDGASAPPAGMWKSIRAQVKPATKKEQSMITPYTMPPVTVASPRRQQPGRFRHTLSIAASFLIVVSVALGGWFVTMQINQPGESEPRLAMLGSTPEGEATPASESETCDVEPLTTDTVMQIVSNPARFMTEGPTGEPVESPIAGSPPQAELWEVDPDLELVGESKKPTEEEFDVASTYANQYLNCLMHGTQAQIWAFYSPVYLQQKILGEFPVFAEESRVRERVKEMSTQPAYYAEMAWEDHLAIMPTWADERQDNEAHRGLDPNIGSLTVNPDYQLALIQPSESFYYESVMSIGISIEDVDGEQIVLTNGVGNSIVPVDPFASGMNAPMIFVQVAKLRNSDGWVIIPWPSATELGWDHY